MRSSPMRPHSLPMSIYVVAWTVAVLLAALALKLGAGLVHWISAA